MTFQGCDIVFPSIEYVNRAASRTTVQGFLLSTEPIIEVATKPITCFVVVAQMRRVALPRLYCHMRTASRTHFTGVVLSSHGLDTPLSNRRSG